MRAGIRVLGLCAVLGCTGFASACGQVFTVGEHTATADLKTEFHPTHVELPTDRLTERGRLDLVRNLVGEQGFAHRALPLGAGLTLDANGPLRPGAEQYRELIYKKGSAAAPGDRVAISAFEIKGDTMVIDLNGGPYLKHRFLRHVSLNGAEPAMNDGQQATGTRITLVFERQIPELSAAEVKALLQPVVDFGAKTGEVAYADTLAVPVKDAIAAHEVKVGMSHRMVLATLGSPESKVREEVDGKRYEEWIYGHVPQTVQFIRFTGDRVSQVKIAAEGRAMEVRTADELPDYLPAAPPTRVIAMGDMVPKDSQRTNPTLMKPGEKAEMDQGQVQGKVIVPPDSAASKAPPAAPNQP